MGREPLRARRGRGYQPDLGLLVVLSGLSATWCLRQLRVSRVSAFAMGTLFALSPYALYRNIDHFALVIYLVPFACTASLWLAAGESHQRWGRTARIAVFAGCALLGINYVYYAFFASFCLLPAHSSATRGTGTDDCWCPVLWASL